MADTKKQEFKGTPGKLALAEDFRTDGKNNRYIILADNSRMVASITRKNASQFKDKTDELGLLHPDPEAEANAHLLLASKDLLEALEMVINGFEWRMESANLHPMDSSDFEMYDICKKAILKAYGHGKD